MVEEGACRLLKRGKLEEEARMALFRMNREVLEYKVVISAVKISPFDLAISWRTFQDNLKPSTTRRIPDVSIDSGSEIETVVCIIIHSSINFLLSFELFSCFLIRS